MFKEGEEANKKYKELKEEFNKVKNSIRIGDSSPIKQLRGSSPMKRVRKVSSFEYYNEIEKMVLGIDTPTHQQTEYAKIHQLISYLGMELSRHRPTEWNEFMTACIGSD